MKDLQASWEVWYEGLGTTYGISPEINFYEDMQAIIRDFNADKLDIVSTSALNYLRMAPMIATNRDPNIYGVLTDGQKMYQYLVVVRSDSDVSDLNDLQGTNLIVRQGDETGQFYLDTLLLRHGQPARERFFFAIQNTESFSKTVLSVFFQKADACLTTEAVFETMVELNPQVGTQLKILERSSDLANGVFFFHQHVPQHIKDDLVTHILDLETSVSGQQILMMYKIDRLVRFDVSDLDSVKALLQDYASYTQQQSQ